MSIRAFLAFDLNSSIREALGRFQDQAERILPVKWISPRSMHLTVKFLGDIEEEQVDGIKAVLRTVVESTPAFSLTIGNIGGFPSLERPRVIWAGVTGQTDRLAILVSNLEAALGTLGFASATQPYHPHVTLSRVKTHSKKVGALLNSSALFNEQLDFGTLFVNRLDLFQSQLSPKGALYSCLWGLCLKESLS